MSVTPKYHDGYLKVKFFLSSYRALIDAKFGIERLEKVLDESKFMIWDWRIIWLGSCATLRTAIDLFQLDAKACIPKALSLEIRNEWNIIKNEPKGHEIYWDFLKRERDNIIHEYSWEAYEIWMKPDGSVIDDSASTLLGMALGGREGSRPLLLMRNGPYKGQDSIELLKCSAEWVEARIFSAIARAGFNPDEERRLGDFAPRPKAVGTMLGRLLDN